MKSSGVFFIIYIIMGFPTALNFLIAYFSHSSNQRLSCIIIGLICLMIGLKAYDIAEKINFYNMLNEMEKEDNKNDDKLQ